MTLSPTQRRVVQIIGIVVGINVLMAIAGQVLRWRIPSHGDEQSDEIALAAIQRGIDLQSHAGAFRGGAARSILGGLRLDLREATLAPEGATLTLSAILGGVQLIVPPDWRVTVSRSRPILGGVDLHPGAEASEAAAATLDLDVTAILGGVQVVTETP
jgi:hypothetical protein